MIKIKALKDGPYLVEGEGIWTLIREGQRQPLGKSSVALCRCGHSRNKPFCDGSHKGAGFKAEALELEMP